MVHQIVSHDLEKISCVVGDESGIVDAELPTKYDFIKQGGSIVIKGAKAEVRDEHIIVVLQENAEIGRSAKKFEKIGLGNDISEQLWEEDEQNDEENDEKDEKSKDS
jgi:hypothetical protein